VSWMLDLVEKGSVPDPVIRFGIRRRVARKLREERAHGASLDEFVDHLDDQPIAIHTDAANEQHYEVPPEFFQLVLGPHLKYSSALYEPGVEDLGEAELRMLDLYLERGQLEDGQEILELGCGWGSLTLHMAAHFPNSRILAISNSRPQREFILARAAERGLSNVEIETVDVNRYSTERRFDRAVSIEMFEHMKNYADLMGRIARMLKPDGQLFVHIFAHRKHAYHYVAEGPDDWMARYFFTGGTMPSVDLLPRFQAELELVERWLVSGTHYQRTSNAWLRNMDAQEAAIRPILARAYGEDEVQRWWMRWRLFFLACAEMFGYRDGQEWLVAHYLFRKRA
jgi:cyclopropane-fatty-acyl-phospholipid synthase